VPTSSRVTTHTVLMVEDNPDHTLLVEIAAQKVDPGVQVRSVRSGEQAMAYLSGKPPFDDGKEHPRPDLVILDLLLPGLGGFEVLEWAATTEEIRGIPWVVLSSSVNPGDRERALGRGAEEFHSKPSDVVELGETIRTILDRWLM